MISSVDVFFNILCISCSILGIILAYITFKKKGKIYILIILGLIFSSIFEILNNFKNQYTPKDIGYIYLLVLGVIPYYYLNFVVNYLYIIRINSLGLKKISII